MGNFLQYSNRLRNFVPALSPQQAEDYVNEAWRDIREANDEWSFLFKQEYWLSPASINLDGLTTTQFSDVLGLTWANLPLIAGANNPAITVRQLRFGLSGGPIYSIESTDVQSGNDGSMAATNTELVSAAAPFAPEMVGLLITVVGAGLDGADLDTTIASYNDPTSIELDVAADTTVVGAAFYLGSQIILDRPYNEGSLDGTAQALCYRILYQPNDPTFERLDHLVDPITGYEFAWEVTSADDLDRMDPQRSSINQPWRAFFHGYDPDTGLPIYELWPGPTVQRAFTAYYWSRGANFIADTDALPPQIQDELLLLRARMLAYEWGMVTDPDRNVRASYANALGYARSRYSTEGQPGRPLGMLETAKRRDRDVYMKEFRRSSRRNGQSWPIDSNFLQSRAFPPSYWGDGYW